MKARILAGVFAFLSLSQAQVNLSSLTTVPATGGATFSGTVPSSGTVVRAQSWSHPMGTLIPNWSFEAKDLFWTPGQYAAVRVSSSAAPSGKFIAQVTSSSSALTGQAGISSDAIPVRAGQAYTLSVLVSGTTGGASIAPAFLQVLPPRSTATAKVYSSCAAYPSPGGGTWQEYKCTLPALVVDTVIQLVLANGGRNAGTALYFDNVLLVEGDASSPALNRQNILEAGSISDPAGVGYHSYSKSGKDANFTVNAVGYDKFWRPETTYLPFFAAGSAIGSQITDLLTPAKSANSSRGGGTHPFSQVISPAPSTQYAVPKTENFAPGDAYAQGTGTGAASGWAMVASVPTAASNVVSTVGTLEAPAVVAGEKPYRYTWSRDRDGAYQLTWSNRAGQMVASARMINKASSTWTLTTYEYYTNGALKKAITPVDAGRITTTYDVAGRVIAKQSADEGTVRFWYDAAGRLAFRQKASQVAASQYTYWAYDAQGRVISEGEIVFSGATWDAMQARAQALAPSTTFPSGGVERIGYIYDEVNAEILETRTNVSGSMILNTANGVVTFPGRNGSGRLVAKYNRNPQYAGDEATDRLGRKPLPLTAEQRLVVDLYGYDTLGRMLTAGKYMGAVTADADRRHAVEYRYDSAGRVAQKIVDQTMAGTLLPDATKATDVFYKYSYDDRGRLLSVMDNAAAISSYTYNNFGQLTRAAYGTTATGATSFRYHLHGQLKGLTYSANSVVKYDETMSYETPLLTSATNGVGAVSNFSGRISSIIEQYGTDQGVVNAALQDGSQTVKAGLYDYDASGRMTAKRTFVPTSAVNYMQGGYAYTTTVPYTANVALSSWYTYDDNDRIVSQRVGSSTATYNYAAGTNKLDNVAGAIKDGSTRNAAAAGNFTYDLDGNQTNDKSKPKWAKYGPNGLPIYLGSGAAGNYIYPLYDADGQMVTAMLSISNPGGSGPTGRVHYVRVAGVTQKVIRETWSQTSMAFVSATKVVNIMGQSSVIGRKLSTGALQFYVKNHQGSTVRVVDINGNPVSSYDYTAYGDLRTLKDGSPTADEKWTGKEYFADQGLYYFGARWYDAELGMWTGPDPMNQFASPYGYGASPAMGRDKDGKLWAEVFGAVIGGYLGGAIAQDLKRPNPEWNPLDWEWDNPKTYIGVAAGAVVGGFAGNAVAGGSVGLNFGASFEGVSIASLSNGTGAWLVGGALGGGLFLAGYDALTEDGDQNRRQNQADQTANQAENDAAILAEEQHESNLLEAERSRELDTRVSELRYQYIGGSFVDGVGIVGQMGTWQTGGNDRTDAGTFISIGGAAGYDMAAGGGVGYVRNAKDFWGWGNTQLNVSSMGIGTSTPLLPTGAAFAPGLSRKNGVNRISWGLSGSLSKSYTFATSSAAFPFLNKKPLPLITRRLGTPEGDAELQELLIRLMGP